MDIQCEAFSLLSEKGLQDRHLQEALKLISVRLQEMRNRAFDQLADGEALRDAAHGIKERTLDRLDEYLQDLEKMVTKNGGIVHWARDGEEANRLILQLARERGVRRLVKGKSMVTEEMDLNNALISRGIEVSETDLGEFIIQLAEEPPSHLVGPAIHKTKEQISRLFSDKLGVKRMDDPQEMTLYARRVLREKFLQADMGITGANFAVAESGSVVLFENEGNIRLSTSLPRIHVAVMGMEKVVPTLEDLVILMKLLARSCTGQKLSSYITILNGPKGRGERDGAEEFHLIILDNGRSGILHDRELRETLYCIRCGACLNFCPVYLKIGGHAYGWVYSGPIGSILTPQLIHRKKAYPLPFASTLCGACADVCPVKIDIPKVLVALRRRYTEDRAWERLPSLFQRGVATLCAWGMGEKVLYEGASRMARLIQPLVIKGKKLKTWMPPLDHWSRYHAMDPLADKMYRQIWKEGDGRGR